jgi:hypothetical protein
MRSPDSAGLLLAFLWCLGFWVVLALTVAELT